MSEITELTGQLEAAQRAMIKTSINEGMQAFRRLYEHQAVIDKCRKRLDKLVGVEEAYRVWKAVVYRVAQEMPHEQDRGNSIERHEGEREEACYGGRR